MNHMTHSQSHNCWITSTPTAPQLGPDSFSLSLSLLTTFELLCLFLSFSSWCKFIVCTSIQVPFEVNYQWWSLCYIYGLLFLFSGLLAILTPSNRPSCITFIYRPHCTHAIIHFFLTLLSAVARPHHGFPWYTTLLPSCLIVLLLPIVSHLLSLPSVFRPPCPLTSPFLAPSGLRDFAFVWKQWVEQGIGWGTRVLFQAVRWKSFLN